MIDKLKDDCVLLRHFPLAAPARENFAPGPRVSFSGKYAIYYLVVREESKDLFSNNDLIGL